MIFYAWTALRGGSPEAEESSVAMGITDDRVKAMRACEETLGTGRATVGIIEAVRPAMTAPTLAPCYAQTGVGWLGRRTGAGEVDWKRVFLRGDRAADLDPGRMEP